MTDAENRATVTETMMGDEAPPEKPPAPEGGTLAFSLEIFSMSDEAGGGMHTALWAQSDPLLLVQCFMRAQEAMGKAGGQISPRLREYVEFEIVSRAAGLTIGALDEVEKRVMTRRAARREQAQAEEGGSGDD